MKLLALILALTCASAQAQTYYALQSGGSQSNTISESQLRLGKVGGVTIRLRKDWIYRSGKFDWSFIDQCRARCVKTGDRYTLLLMGGFASDPFAESELLWWERYYAAAGARYGKDPLCAGMHCTGATKDTPSEWQWPSISARTEAGTQRIIRACHAGFPDKPILWGAHGSNWDAQLRIIKYGRSRIKPGLWWVGHNSLKASTSLSSKHNQICVEAGKLGCGMWWQMTCGARNEPTRFGSRSVMDGVAAGFKLADQAGVPRSSLFFEIYPSDLGDLR
jgi:hypothetical protein